MAVTKDHRSYSQVEVGKCVCSKVHSYTGVQYSNNIQRESVTNTDNVVLKHAKCQDISGKLTGKETSFVSDPVVTKIQK